MADFAHINSRNSSSSHIPHGAHPVSAHFWRPHSSASLTIGYPDDLFRKENHLRCNKNAIKYVQYCIVRFHSVPTSSLERPSTHGTFCSTANLPHENLRTKRTSYVSLQNYIEPFWLRREGLAAKGTRLCTVDICSVQSAISVYTYHPSLLRCSYQQLYIIYLTQQMAHFLSVRCQC